MNRLMTYNEITAKITVHFSTQQKEHARAMLQQALHEAVTVP